MTLASYWIRRFASNPVWYAVQYHADQEVDELRRFWGDTLGMDPPAIRIQRSPTATRWQAGLGGPSTAF